MCFLARFIALIELMVHASKLDTLEEKSELPSCQGIPVDFEKTVSQVKAKREVVFFHQRPFAVTLPEQFSFYVLL